MAQRQMSHTVKPDTDEHGARYLYCETCGVSNPVGTPLPLPCQAPKNQGGGQAVPFFGRHTVDMSVVGVLNYLRSHQIEPKFLSSDVIHTKEDRSFELCGRDDAIKASIDAFTKRRSNFAMDERPQDRTKYPVVVFSGMKGLGKTRMLEEWRMLLDRASVPQPRMAVLVMYGNGHAPKSFEDDMPIEAAFSWRMLHRLFVDGNCKNTRASVWESSDFLPRNAGILTLRLAFEVVRAFAEFLGTVSSGQTLSLFLGIDEYQKIPVGPLYDADAIDQHSEREKTLLWQLMAALDGCRDEAIGIDIYLAFAGTKWGPLSIAGSSVPEAQRAPLRLLSPSEMEDVVRSQPPFDQLLAGPSFRRHLFFLGGIPRPSIELTLTYISYGPYRSFDAVWQERVRRPWLELLTTEALLRLVAFAVSGGPVQPADEPGIIAGYSWSRLFDEGLLLFREDNRVALPYCVFRLAAETNPLTLPDLPSRCLVQNLAFLRRHVDDTLYDLEPWQLWEKFGACYLALRINALLMLGCSSVSFVDLCSGSIYRGCNYAVELCPMKVVAIEEAISGNLPDVVTEKDTHQRLNWVNGNAGIRYVLINGTSGKGVDIFSALRLANNSDQVLLVLDQRKVVAESLGTVAARAYLEKALIVPSCLPKGSKVVRGLFSMLSSFHQPSEVLSVDTFVLSYKQHDQFHGCLSCHPACKTFVDVNFDNISTLRLLRSVFGIADKIMKRRKRKFFETIDEFTRFCAREQCQVTQVDRFRVVAAAAPL